MKISFDFPGIVNNDLDFRCVFNKPTEHYDVLIFSDSRGTDLKRPGEYEWATKLYNNLSKQNLKVLLVSRPKRNTGFFTLLCFLKHNKHLTYNTLYTNLGIVDFMPMKIENVTDILSQSEFCEVNIEFYKADETFISLTGEKIDLFIVNGIDAHRKLVKEIEKFFSKIYLIETPEFLPNINIQRARPKLFFKQLPKTNLFLKLITEDNKNIKLIPLGKDSYDLGVKISYDAVHLTEQGHYWFLKYIDKHLKNHE